MDKNKKITLFSLIMMIFSGIFGFANTPIAFLQMGYASIIWYIFAAVFFFLPLAMMIAEYGSTFKEEHGGFYSWLSHAVGEKMAFIGTFLWLSNLMIWLLSTSTKIYIPFSALLFGKDVTQSWTIGSLNSTQVIGLLGIAWLLFVTICASRGVNVISKISSIGGTLVSMMVIVFLVTTGVIFVAGHGQIQETITAHAFIKSPNPEFQSPIAMISFVVYAIFAYGGLETLGGVIDNIDKPEKTFPKGIAISSLLIAGSYSLMILLWGVSTNWQRDLSSSSVNLGNITYVMMQHLGTFLGQTLGLSAKASAMIGNIFIRFVGLGMLLAYVGSFFLFIYSPIKSFILGSKHLWPEKLTKLNKHGIPENAMWMQTLIVGVLLFLISFGGSQAKTFYTILTDMSNVSTAISYVILIGAFPIFKKKHFDQPFEVYKKHTLTLIITYLSFAVLLFGVVFTCLQPFLVGDYTTGIWTLVGPILFTGIALGLYHSAQKKNK